MFGDVERLPPLWLDEPPLVGPSQNPGMPPQKLCRQRLKSHRHERRGAIVPMEIEFYREEILTASPDYRSAGRSRITFRQWVTVASERVDASPAVTRRQRSASSTTPV